MAALNYLISIEPHVGETTTYDLGSGSDLVGAKLDAEAIFARMQPRSVAIVTGMGRARKVVDTFDGGWSSEQVWDWEDDDLSGVGFAA